MKAYQNRKKVVSNRYFQQVYGRTRRFENWRKTLEGRRSHDTTKYFCIYP